jgi:hypothetical protein
VDVGRTDLLVLFPYGRWRTRDGLCAGLSVPSLFIHPSETNDIQTAAAAAELTVEKMSI